MDTPSHSLPSHTCLGFMVAALSFTHRATNLLDSCVFQLLALSLDYT